MSLTKMRDSVDKEERYVGDLSSGCHPAKALAIPPSGWLTLGQRGVSDIIYLMTEEWDLAEPKEGRAVPEGQAAQPRPGGERELRLRRTGRNPVSTQKNQDG